MPALTQSAHTQKATCVVSLVLVFLCGAVAGAVAMNFGHVQKHKEAFWTPPAKERTLQNWKEQLDLTPVQTEQINSILDDFGRYYRDVLGDGKARIQHVLTPEQRRKFDKMLDEVQAKQR